jgi:uncharacterized linocin/CFP29 family protein
LAELNWTDAQWQTVNDAVTEAFGRASVTSAFLPMYGPLAGSTETVRNERIDRVRDVVPQVIKLDTFHDAVNLKLVNLTVNVELTSEQVADDALANALFVFRRAANVLALEQDRVVFAGYGRGLTPEENSPCVVNQVNVQRGLADLPARYDFAGLITPPPDANNYVPTRGQLVVVAVVNAMTELEENSHPSPFACVLGNDLYVAVQDPSASLVLPADRLTPMLKGGPLLRSGQIDRQTGIVVSLASNAIDVVIGTPPTAQFLQRQGDGKFLFRVYLRFSLRIRDDAEPAVSGFRILPEPGTYEREGTRVRLLKGLQ